MTYQYGDVIHLVHKENHLEHIGVFDGYNTTMPHKILFLKGAPHTPVYYNEYLIGVLKKAEPENPLPTAHGLYVADKGQITEELPGYRIFRLDEDGWTEYREEGQEQEYELGEAENYLRNIYQKGYFKLVRLTREQS